MGTTLLLKIIGAVIFLAFFAIVAGIACAMGLNFDINQMLYTDYVIQPGMIAFFGIAVLLFIIMLCVMVFILIMYSMAQLSRVKYKLSGIATLRYSRKLTKGKKGKIFGNALLIALIYLAISYALSYASTLAYNNSIPFIPFLINITDMFLGMLVTVFWAAMFINFDNTKGKEILSSSGFGAVCEEDRHFPRADETDKVKTENVKTETKEPEGGEKAAAEAPAEDSAVKEKDTQEETGAKTADEACQGPREDIETDEKEKEE
jgi:hypothetical protein